MYVAGALDQLLTIAGSVGDKDMMALVVHYRSCMDSAKIGSNQLAENIRKFAFDTACAANRRSGSWPLPEGLFQRAGKLWRIASSFEAGPAGYKTD